MSIFLFFQFNIVCDQSWKKPFAISLHFYGMMIGCALAGYITDRYVQNSVNKERQINFPTGLTNQVKLEKFLCIVQAVQ